MSEIVLAASAVTAVGTPFVLMKWPGTRAQFYRRLAAWLMLRATGIEARQAAMKAAKDDVQRAAGVVA